MSFTQEARRIGINTPLGPDVLLLTNVDGLERMSRLYSYHVRMISERESIDPAEIVGKNVTLSLLDADDQPRYLNGYVSRFAAAGRGDRASMYHAEVVPWLWFLTRRSDCRIFQGKTVPQIIEEVFRHIGFTDFEFAQLKGPFEKREYTVQYGETDFNFVSRLMEHEGIFYFFRHEASRHVMVLSDNNGAYKPCKNAQVRYSGSQAFAEIDNDLTAWEHLYEFRSGQVAFADYNFETPQAPVPSKERTLVQLSGNSALELFDYPGDFLDKGGADRRARIRMQEEEVPHNLVRGGSKCRSFGPGATFTVASHSVSEEEGKAYVITAVRHSASAGSYVTSDSTPEGYHNEFECIPADTVYRPTRETPRALVRGPQTAKVVGPPGEEIHVDKYGRVKVQFPWDRYGKSDDVSSCWIRVAQEWAGQGWGAMHIPRIGQEVIVDFLEGDPDRPIITGRVYNAEQTPPYKLPDNKHFSGLKTNSTKGGAGFNELRFDDTKGEEQIFIHGEKNLDIRIKNDAFTLIKRDQHLIVENNDLALVKQDRHTQIERDQVTKIGRDRHLTVAGNEAAKVAGSQSNKIGGDVIEVYGGNQSTQVTGNLYLSAMQAVIEATAGLTIKCGGSSIVLDAAGVTIKGPVVTVDGGLTKINSGPGSPPASGSAGALVSPLAPEAAQEADDADPGEVEKIKAAQRESQTGKYGATPPPQFKPKPQRPEEQKKTVWIEIEMVDEAGNPAAGERFELILPNGEVYPGMLNTQGLARVDGIDPGSCQITFPNLDKETWERA